MESTDVRVISRFPSKKEKKGKTPQKRQKTRLIICGWLGYFPFTKNVEFGLVRKPEDISL